MTQTKVAGKPLSPFEWLTSNFIQIVAIVVILLMATDIIVRSPKLPDPFSGSWLRGLVSLGSPFAILITIGLTLRVNFVRVTKARSFSDRFGAAIFFLMFASMFIAQFTLGADHPLWVAEYDLIYIHGSAAVECLCAVAVMMMLIRDVRPRSAAQGYLILIVILGIMVVSPVGDFLPTTLLDISNWFAIYPSSVGAAVMTFGLYMGLLGLVIRIFTFKEKIRVGAD